MNCYEAILMEAPSVHTDGYCAVCHRWGPTEKHHIVERSHGGKDGPTIDLCGFGNTCGCHGLAHAHKLHFRYRGHWEFLITKVSMKYEKALDMEGWARLHVECQ